MLFRSNALNIITGFENGKFMPKDNVTREQMAKMICVLDNGGKEPQLATGNTFSDVAADRWSNKYIEACASRGVVVGVGGGKFAPAGKVTATQAAKMLLVELGYDDDLQKYSGADWATKVNVDATKKGYYEDLEDIDVNAPLTREHAAQMIWNALQAKEVEYDYTLIGQDGNLSSNVTAIDKKETLMEDKYGALVLEGTLANFEYKSKDSKWTYTVGAVTTEDNAPVLTGDVEASSATDYTGMYAQNVKMVFKKNASTGKYDALGIFEEDSSVLFSGVIGDLPKLAGGDDSFKFDGTKYKLDNGTVDATNVYFFQHDSKCFENSVTLNAYAGYDDDNSENVTKNDYQSFKAIDDDNDGKIDFLVVTPVQIEKVANRPTDTFKLTKVDAAIPAYFHHSSDSYTVEDVTAYDGIAKDDWVVHTYAANTADDTDVFVKANLVNGKITSRDLPDIYVDGTKYALAATYTEESKPGTTLADAVEYNGYIFDADASGATDVSDYVIVLAGDQTGYGSTVKLLFTDGTKKVVDLKTFDFGKDNYGNTINPFTYYYGYGGIQHEPLDSFPTHSNGIAAVTNKLFVYDKNKDEEYTLTSVDCYVTPGSAYPKADTNNNKTGFDFAGNTLSGDKIDAQSKSSTKTGFVNGYGIADDAVIFVKTTASSDSVKVITGATMKSMNETKFGTSNNVSFVLATKDSKTNSGEVAMAYVNLNDSDVKNGDTKYGYVTGVSESQNEDKEAILSVTLWTADGEKTFDTVKADSEMTLTTASVGHAIEYTVNSDNVIDTAKHTGVSAAITSMDSSAMTFGANITVPDTSPAVTIRAGDRAEFDDDVQYIFIDSKEKEGANGYDQSSILFADTVTDSEGHESYVNNAYVVFDTTGNNDILAVFYDVNNEIK